MRSSPSKSVPPYPLDEQVARHRASLLAQQQLEYLRLLGTQIHRVSVHRYRARGRIHQDIRVAELTRAQPQPAARRMSACAFATSTGNENGLVI